MATLTNYPVLLLTQPASLLALQDPASLPELQLLLQARCTFGLGREAQNVAKTSKKRGKAQGIFKEKRESSRDLIARDSHETDCP